MLAAAALAALSLAPNINPTRSLGSLKISEVGLGTLNLALDKEEDPDAAAALRASVEAGCNFVDTAEAYGFGTSEKLTAWAAQQIGIPIGTAEGELHVATKFAPVPWRPDAKSVVDACRASADRLGVDQIPLYQIHVRVSQSRSHRCFLTLRHLPFGFEYEKEEGVCPSLFDPRTCRVGTFVRSFLTSSSRLRSSASRSARTSCIGKVWPSATSKVLRPTSACAIVRLSSAFLNPASSALGFVASP